MSKEKPDHHDAQIVMQLYDLRREAVMRESRKAIAGQFWPKAYDDLVAVTKPDHPMNAAMRQVSSYWEMVFGMARHGIVHADYLVENSGEGLFLYAKVAGFLPRFREEFSPTSLQHAEWAAKETANGRRIAEMFGKRVAAVLAAPAS